MNVNNPDDMTLDRAIVVIGYSYMIPLNEAAKILAYKEVWPAWGITSIDDVSKKWKFKMVTYYTFNERAKALRLYKNEIKKQETKNEQI